MNDSNLTLEYHQSNNNLSRTNYSSDPDYLINKNQNDKVEREKASNSNPLFVNLEEDVPENYYIISKMNEIMKNIFLNEI